MSSFNKENLIEDLDEYLGDELDELKAKRPKIDEQIQDFHDNKLDTFLEWCKNKKILIDCDKVKVVSSQTSHNYGMIALKDINQDEILCRIPKSAVLEPRTTQINELLVKSNKIISYKLIVIFSLDSKSLKSKSNWSKLIISLMFELNNSISKWREYLDCFPNNDMFDLPMYWEM